MARKSSKSESPDIAPLDSISDIQDNPLAEPKVNVKTPDKPVDQPNVDPVPEPTAKEPLVKGDPNYNVLDGVDKDDDWKYHNYTEADQAKRDANRPALDPSFFQDQNPDMVGNPRYQPGMPDMNLRHDATSYSKKENLINRTRTKLRQEDPDGNVWKTEVDTTRQRNWFNNLI